MSTYIDNKGYVWQPYSIEFDSPEGLFSFDIYAISFEHAELQLQAIKESAKVSGRLEGIINNR